jgi:hypothetical protein
VCGVSTVGPSQSRRGRGAETARVSWSGGLFGLNDLLGHSCAQRCWGHDDPYIVSGWPRLARISCTSQPSGSARLSMHVRLCAAGCVRLYRSAVETWTGGCRPAWALKMPALSPPGPLSGPGATGPCHGILAPSWAVELLELCQAASQKRLARHTAGAKAAAGWLCCCGHQCVSADRLASSLRLKGRDRRPPAVCTTE